MLKMKNFEQVVTHGDNTEFREKFVADWIGSLAPGKLLDVGSGQMPFREFAIGSGHTYQSHDFEKYSPNPNMPGLYSSNYLPITHDFVSDITELPKNRFDYVLCTEVLEHVPDPVSAIKSAMLALRIGGVALFTVPLRSQIHQAPYFFSAGLSPFWFDFHANSNGWRQLKIVVVGDQLDSLSNEIPAIMNNLSIKRWYFEAALRRSLIWFFSRNRFKYSRELRSSGGLGVYAILKREN
jgi:SAM-dependent methyltransferase